jgi:hypothetical protein
MRCFKESRDGGSLQIPVSKLTLKLQAEHKVSPAGIMPLIKLSKILGGTAADFRPRAIVCFFYTKLLKNTT